MSDDLLKRWIDEGFSSIRNIIENNDKNHERRFTEVTKEMRRNKNTSVKYRETRDIQIEKLEGRVTKTEQIIDDILDQAKTPTVKLLLTPKVLTIIGVAFVALLLIAIGVSSDNVSTVLIKVITGV